MKRKLLSVLLSLTLLVTAVVVGVFALPVSAATSGGYTYKVSDGKATITDYTGSGGAITIPSALGGYPVTTIGERAFYGCTSLTSVTIGNNVTTIGIDAFLGCTSLTSVTIGDSVTSIGEWAFYNCSNLTSIEVGKKNPSYCSVDGVLFNKNKTELIQYPRGKSGAYSIPNSVTTIGDWAFSNCTKLTSVTIGDGVTSIGEYAFSRCTSLTSVTIPDSVATIGNRAFYECTSLTAIEVDEDNVNYCSADGVLFNKDKTTLVQYPAGKPSTSYTIPDSVTTIGSSAFYGCTNLTSVNIPDSVTTIGNSAFYDCTSLTSVTIPDSVTTIGSYAFEDCTSLTSITLPFVGEKADGSGKTHFGYIFGASSYSDNSSYVPTSLKTVVITGGTSIGSYAFRDCTSLTSVTIPDSVTAIGYGAFSGCTRLIIVYITDLAAWCGIDFGNDSANPLYYAKHLFLNNELVTELVIPDSVTTIGDYAFRSCTSLTSVTLGKKVKTIGSYAFYNCTSLTSVTFGKKVKTIGSSAFYGCKKLTSMTIPDSVTSLSFTALPSSLTSLTIGKGITYIPKGALSGLNKLKSLTIPFVGKELNGNEYTHFAYIFGEAQSSNSWYEATCVPKSLKTVTVTGGILIDNYAFYKCANIEKVYIRDGVKELGDYVFGRCLNLKTVSYADSVKRIGWDTYDYCPSLEMVYCTAGSAAEYDAKYYNVPYRALDTVKLSKTAFAYNGKTQKPSVVVKDSAGKTISTAHYTVTWPSASKSIGTYKVKVTFKGYFTGTKTLTYKINPIDVSKCKITLSATSYTYNGSVKKPTVTVKNANGTKLTTSSYTVTYASGRKNVGTYKVTVKMKGNYTGTKTLTFKINPAKTTVSKLTAGTKKLTVAITKKTTQVTGYQIQYSTSKSFKSYKSKTLTSYKTTSATLTGLKAKTTYYVRVRTYKTVNGVKYYSGWSTVKYLKTK